MSKYECVILSRDKIERFAVYMNHINEYNCHIFMQSKKKIHEKIKISQNTLN